MPATKEQLDGFHQFALETISNGGAGFSIEEMLFQWRETQERADVRLCVQQAIKEIDAGGGQPLDEAIEEIRSELGISVDC